ncbi:hypothetical protein [Streptomyces longwoodensis]|uniref:hypothetical protein n=1 Tax=Streptomyces longwoodensis TaxID=68231 RepID=UPI0033C0CCF8
MTAQIMTRRSALKAAARNPEYACSQCNGWHAPGPCPTAVASSRQLGELLARMVREADARVPAGRKARRTVQETAPGYVRQPVLTLHRPDMADDACPLCLRWNCTGTDCPPGAAPAPTQAREARTAVPA